MAPNLGLFGRTPVRGPLGGTLDIHVLADGLAFVEGVFPAAASLEAGLDEARLAEVLAAVECLCALESGVFLKVTTMCSGSGSV
jgi:hypothetical protein